MKNNLTEVVFILDRSGSMSGLEGDTIGGFNSMFKKQREEEGDANVTTVLFDDEIEMLHKRVNIKEIKNITSKDYYVRGCTALLDAIGYSINFMINYEVMNSAISNCRVNGAVDESWKSRVEEDYEMRKE